MGKRPATFKAACGVVRLPLHITPLTLHKISVGSEAGIALLIVVSVLTVVGIMGVAFAFSMYLETQATHHFVSTTQARYLAEAGVSHARALLDEDRLSSRVDDSTEGWATKMSGSEVDVDGDGAREARWWPVAGTDQHPSGRYALKIVDEAGKANLNAAQITAQGLGAVNLTTLFEQAGIQEAARVAAAVEAYRYGGPGGRPGEDGVDDDRDGVIDEPDEYQPLALRGNDRRLEALEELTAIGGVTPEDVRRLSRVATVYSVDLNVSVTNKSRVNVNTATADELLAVLLDAGVEDPWQAAVNMADAVDPDLEMSRVTKSSHLVSITDQGPRNGWVWRTGPVGHYASDEPTDTALTWVAQVPSGVFYVRARGLRGVKVGDVVVDGTLKPSVDDGESLGLLTLQGTLTIEVINREPDGTTCAVQGLELVPAEAAGGVVIRGIEAIRLNEFMVEPKATLPVSSATFNNPQGSGWSCGASFCTNAGVGRATWTWTTPLLQPGRYYVRVFGRSSGDTVGVVSADGRSQLLHHGQRHPSTITVSQVGQERKVSVTIDKPQAGEPYYFQSLEVSLQPDAEYLELINLSDHDIPVGGWTVEGEATLGRQGKFPEGAVVKAHALLVAAVDLDDTQDSLQDNGLDARTAWQLPETAQAVQLVFPGGAPSPDDDWLKVVVPEGSPARLMLRTKEGAIADEVEYPLPLPTTVEFQSLEKGDPSVVVDADHDGLDEGWYPSLSRYTPGLPNDNEGLKEKVELKTIVHDPLAEVSVLNRPLGGVGELAGLPSGQPWKPFSSADLAKVVDRLTVEGVRLEAEGHLVAGQDAWQEKAEGYYEYSSTAAAIPGTWQWTGLPDGNYRLSFFGCRGCSDERFSIRWARADGSFTGWSPPLSTDAQGRVIVGQLTVGAVAEASEQGTAPNTLTLEVKCVSQHGICHLDYVQLDPQMLRIGAVNVNTAPREVLLALPGMTEAIASRLIAGRPYGDQHQKGRGIGDLLVGDVLSADEEGKLAVFRRIGHLLTTRSDVFQIISLGQTVDDSGRAVSSQRIETVVQR